MTFEYVQTIVEHWWKVEGNLMLTAQLEELRRSTGYVLRMDHTYKAVSSIGIYTDSKWVILYSKIWNLTLHSIN